MKNLAFSLFTLFCFNALAQPCTPPTVSATRGIVCRGSCIMITASANGTGNSFRWSNGATTDTTNVCPDSTTVYTYTVTNPCGDSTVATTTVTVYPSQLFACCDTAIGIRDSAILKTWGDTRAYQWYPSSSLNCDSCATVIAKPSVTTTYYVTGRDSDGCNDTVRLTVIVGPSAIPFISGIGYVNIYPNPSSNTFTLNLSKPARLEVYDITGRLLISKIGKEGENNFGEELSPGMYFLVVDGKKGMKVVKL